MAKGTSESKIQSDEEWSYDFLESLVEDIEENRNIRQCIECGKCVE